VTDPVATHQGVTDRGHEFRNTVTLSIPVTSSTVCVVAGAARPRQPHRAHQVAGRVYGSPGTAIALLGHICFRGCANMGSFTLPADEADELDGTGTGGPEPVWGAGVELGGLS
jgi:hypothetical protein